MDIEDQQQFEIYKIQAIKVLKTMLIDRGYKIIIEDEQSECDEKYSIKAEMNGKILLCFIDEEDKLNIQGIKDRICILNKLGAVKCIIVYRNDITPSAKKSLYTTDYSFETFSLSELQLNITHHRLVPKHEKLSQEEKQKLEKYKGQLPYILHTDAISRYYEFKKGDYIKITRKDGSVMYRVVK